jgi:hypothetical protein
VYTFLSAERRTIFAIRVSIAKPDGHVVAHESWTNDERDAADLAEGIAEWIEVRSENSTDDLDATITVWNKHAR